MAEDDDLAAAMTQAQRWLMLTRHYLDELETMQDERTRQRAAELGVPIDQEPETRKHLEHAASEFTRSIAVLVEAVRPAAPEEGHMQVDVGGRAVDIEWVEKTQTYHFHVPELHITGGGQKTFVEARRAAAEAIDFALEPPSNT